jgi:hypothetical protein
MIFVSQCRYFSHSNDRFFFLDRIVQNLSSDDTNDVSKAMQESDVLLKEISKTGVDRTVINKTSSPQQQTSPGKRNRFKITNTNISFLFLIDAFMSALEKDAAERAENRRKNKLLADEFKAKGNDAFHQQLYDQAIDYYTQVNLHEKQHINSKENYFRV